MLTPDPTDRPIDFRALFARSPNPYVLLDPAYRIVEMNEAYLGATMRTRAGLTGQSMFEAFPGPADASAALRASIDGAFARGEPDHLPLIRYDIARPDGGIDERYWSATHTPLADGAGRVAFVLQHTVDVTELHRLRRSAGGSAPIETDVIRRAEAVTEANRALDAERQRLRSLFQQAPGFMAVLTGPRHVFELVNAAYLTLVGPRDLIGMEVRAALHEVTDQGFFELLDQVYRSGRPYLGRAVPLTLRREADAQPELLHLDFIYQPITDAAGAVAGIFVQGHDVTERMRAEAALARSHARMREVLETISDAFYATDAEGRLTYVNRRAEALWGRPRDALLGQRAEEALALDAAMQGAHAAAAAGTSVQRLEHHAAALGAWLETSIHPGTTGLSVFVRDITERHRAEERRMLMVNELNHRVKNSLAVVQGIASQTLRAASDLGRAREDLTARLVALARAHDLLTSESWEGADLREVVRASLEGGLGIAPARYWAEGPELRLTPNAALSLALALHELSTNAMKYGALSNDDGRVAIAWSVAPEPGADAQRLVLQWQERGGPPVAEPGRRGFGTRLLERGLSAELHGAVDLRFAAQGLSCRIEALI